ncbi:hypothetical protein AB0L65_48200 [Nonomuraea sp. NPDC052116]|uniref:hypothetical protein n=1 Tax=Nonomuraea sp. NPDC052116 TaxID=3155665 RepID=UPI003421769C
MTHSEGDLRALLDRRAAADENAERAPDLDAIVRRGRRIRRGRGLLATTAVMGIAAAAVAAVPWLTGGTVPVNTVPADSANVKPGGDRVEVPRVFEARYGKKVVRIPLLREEHFIAAGKGETLTFTPAAPEMALKVICRDPGAWVVTAIWAEGEKPAGAVVRCGPDGAMQHEEATEGQKWVGSPQHLRIWVFPADAPIVQPPRGSRPGEYCRTADPEVKCEKYSHIDILKEGMADKLAAQVGESPMAWSVGIYEKPVSAE